MRDFINYNYAYLSAKAKDEVYWGLNKGTINSLKISKYIKLSISKYHEQIKSTINCYEPKKINDFCNDKYIEYKIKDDENTLIE